MVTCKRHRTALSRSADNWTKSGGHLEAGEEGAAVPIAAAAEAAMATEAAAGMAGRAVSLITTAGCATDLL